MDKKIIEDIRQWKPPFKLGNIVTLYNGIKANSWAGKISDKWDGIYIVHQTLGKGTYLIKSYQDNNPRLKRVHGNRLKLYQIPDVFWNHSFERTLGDNLDNLLKLENFQPGEDKPSKDATQEGFCTMLNPHTFKLLSTINNEVVDTLQLFENEPSLEEDTTNGEWTFNLTIEESDNYPFLNPNKAFQLDNEDAKHLLRILIPPYNLLSMVMKLTHSNCLFLTKQLTTSFQMT